MRVALEDTGIWVSGLGRLPPPSVGGLNQSAEGLREQNKRGRKGGFAPSLCLTSELEQGSPALRLGVTPSHSSLITPPAGSPGLQYADSRWWDFPASVTA